MHTFLFSISYLLEPIYRTVQSTTRFRDRATTQTYNCDTEFEL